MFLHETLIAVQFDTAESVFSIRLEPFAKSSNRQPPAAAKSCQCWREHRLWLHDRAARDKWRQRLHFAVAARGVRVSAPWASSRVFSAGSASFAVAQCSGTNPSASTVVTLAPASRSNFANSTLLFFTACASSVAGQFSAPPGERLRGQFILAVAEAFGARPVRTRAPRWLL